MSLRSLSAHILLLLLISETGLFSQIASHSGARSPHLNMYEANLNASPRSAEAAYSAQPLDPTDSLRVRLIGRWSNDKCLAVDFMGTMAYLGNGAYLEIIDCSRPDQPAKVGRVQLAATVLAVKVVGSYAYVAAGNAGLHIVDISIPSHPLVIGNYDSPGMASGLDIYATLIFLADGEAGIRVIETANRFAPKEIGFLDTDGSALKVAVNGNFAYLADGSSGLRVIDISNSYQPSLIAQYTTTDDILDVAVRGTFVFLAAQSAGVRALTISNPYQPLEIGFLREVKSALALAVNEYFAFVIDDHSGLRIIDISNPYQLSQIGFFTTSGDPSDVALGSNSAYVTDEHLGLRVIDASKPNLPQQRAWFAAGGISHGVAIQDRYAYVAQQQAGIRIIDLADPSQPALLGSLNLAGRAEEIKIKNNDAYLTNADNGIRIIKITDPLNPVEQGYFDKNIHAKSISIEGHLAFIADSAFGLRIVDIANPSSPVLIGSCEIPNSQSEDIGKASDYVFLAGGDKGLQIIDVKNPAQPKVVGVLNDDATAISVAIQDNFAFIGYREKKLRIVTIADHTNPREVGHFDLMNPVNELAVKGRYVYLANGAGGLRVIDAMAVANPVEVGYYVTGSPASDVAIDEKFIYLVDRTSGLSILKFDLTASNVAPELPILLAPANHSFVNTLTPQLSWQAPRDQNGDLLHFVIELDADGDWNQVDCKVDSRNDPVGFSPMPPVLQNSGSIHYTSQFLLSEGNWFWRVLAWDGLVASDFSLTWKFAVDTTAPIIQKVAFENPGFEDDWFNPLQDTLVNVAVLYSELFPERAKLASDFFPDTIRISSLPGGYDQEIRLQFSIANQPDGAYSIVMSIEDSAGNVGTSVKKIQFDSAPPAGYYSDAPDTIAAGEDYVVHIWRANDGQGSGVAGIFFDVFESAGQEPMTAQDSLVGKSEPGVYYYCYFAVDNLGNRGIIKCDTTVVIPPLTQAAIYPVPQWQAVEPGKSFWLDIVVGTSQMPVQKLSRVSYQLNYADPKWVSVISDSILPGSLLGEDIDFNYRVEANQGTMTITTAQRAGGSGASGFGSVGQIRFKSNADAPDQTPIVFRLTSISGSDPLGFPIELLPHDTTITIIRPIFDFAMIVSPDSQAVYPGETTKATALFSPLGEFDARISLRVSELPDGMQATYPSQQFAIPDSITIQFSIADQIEPGIYHPLVAASGGGISRQQSIAINVLEPASIADFIMTIAPDSQTIQQGESTKFTLSFQPVGEFSSPVAMTITNLPTGMNATYPVDSFKIPRSLEIEFTTASDIEPGVYYPLINASGGGIAQHDSVQIRIASRSDFIMNIVPDRQSVIAGDTIDFEISFIPVGTFDSNITLSVANVPQGMESIFSSVPFSIPKTLAISFRTPNNFPPGIYYPIVTASGGGITHQKTVILHVLARDASIRFSGVKPNPFTPNDDGFNDRAIFYFPEINNISTIILIFDMNGRHIAEIRGSAHWDGKDDRGREAKPGAYIYIIKVEDKVIAKGVVSLAR